MGSSRVGLGSNRTPQEAKRELPLPLLLVLLDSAKLDFGLSTVANPAQTVFIRKSTRTRRMVDSIPGLSYALGANFVAVNQMQWDLAVAPVMAQPQFNMTTPLNRSLLNTGRVNEILAALGFALEASFVQAGYGPPSSAFPITQPPQPVPFVPTDIDGLIGWFDASDSTTITLEGAGPEVRRWENKNTDGTFNASQQTLADQPTVVTAAQNGLDVVSFDGVSQHLTLPLADVFDFTLFVVGKYDVGATSDIGTWFAATGFDGSFGGPDCRIFTTNVVGPVGVPVTSRNNINTFTTTSVLNAGVYDQVEYAGKTTPQSGSLQTGVRGVISQVFSGDTSNDYWDDSRQLFGESPPILAALGRRNAGINGAATYDYLEGSIGEILLYTSVLSNADRSSVRSYLKTKWALP